MSKMLKVLTTSVKIHSVYKANIFFNIISMFTRILLAFILWGVAYESNSLIGGYTYNQMLLYYILSSFILQLDKTDIIANSMAEEVQNGRFAKYIIMPINVKNYFLFYSLGDSFLNLFSFICCIGFIIFFGLRLSFTITAAHFLGLLVVIVLGILIMANINFIIGTLAIKYYDITVFMMVKDNILSLITGSLLPLSLFPKGILNIMHFFPFYYIGYYPVNLLITGDVESIFMAACILTVWLFVLHLAATRLFKKYIMSYEGIGL